MVGDQIDEILSSDKIDLNRFRQAISQELEFLREKNEDQSQLLQNIIESRNKELFRIKSELHDGPLQIIKSENKQIRQLLESINNYDAKITLEKYLMHLECQLEVIRNILLDKVDSMNEETVELITEMRSVVREKKQILNGTKWINLRINFKCEKQNEFIVERRISNLICCFIKETMNNAIIHGNASRIDIIVNNIGEKILVMTIDNGNGFQFPIPSKQEDFQKLANSGRIGLHLLRSEVLTLHGSFEMKSKKENGGLIVKITIPKKAEK